MFNEAESTARKEGIIKAFDTGVRYLEVLQLGDADGSPVKYLSLLTLRMCCVVAIFLSKVLHSTYREYVDIEAATDAFNFTISIYKKCSVEDNDINGRTTKFLAQVWAIHADIFDNSPQPPSISIKSRLFFSIVHDSLWQWREKYAGKPSNGAPSLPAPLIGAASSSPCVEPDSAGRAETTGINSSTILETFGEGVAAINSKAHGVDLSAFTNQQFPGPEHFPANESTLWPSNAGLPHDSSRHDESQDAPGGLGHDLLFPDGVVSCSEAWYRLTRE